SAAAKKAGRKIYVSKKKMTIDYHICLQLPILMAMSCPNNMNPIVLQATMSNNYCRKSTLPKPKRTVIAFHMKWPVKKPLKQKMDNNIQLKKVIMKGFRHVPPVGKH